jgi:hypothetical protein
MLVVPETEPSELMKMAPAVCDLTLDTDAVKLTKHMKTQIDIASLFIFIVNSSRHEA